MRSDPDLLGVGDARQRLGVELGEDAVDRLGAVGRGVELGTDPADRPVGLRGQQDGEQAGLQRHRGVGEPQADGDGDDGDRDRGEQLQGRRRHEGQLQRAHRRDPVPLAHLADDLDLALGAAVADEGGQAAHHVEEVAGQRGQRRPALLGLGLGGAPDQRGEEGQQGEGEQHDEAAEPVDPEQRGQGEHRHDGAGDERGEEAGGIRLDRRGALGGEGDRAVGSGTALRGGGEPPVDEPAAQGHRHLDTDPGRDPLGGPGQHRAHREQRGEPQPGGAQGGALDDRDHQRRDRYGQADRGDPLEDAHDRQDGDRLACSRRRPEQPRVEGPHRGVRLLVTSGDGDRSRDVLRAEPLAEGPVRPARCRAARSG